MYPVEGIHMGTKEPSSSGDLSMVLKAKKRIWFNISVWVVVGAIAVMAVVSAVMTFAHFQRQKEQAVIQLSFCWHKPCSVTEQQ